MAAPESGDRPPVEPEPTEAATDEPASVTADEGPREPVDARAGASGSPGRADRDQLDRLLALVGPRLDEVRALLDDAGSRWRGDAVRVGEGTRHRLRDLFREFGLVTRDEWDELELRVAQLEHRLRLVEERGDEEEAEWRTSG